MWTKPGFPCTVHVHVLVLVRTPQLTISVENDTPQHAKVGFSKCTLEYELLMGIDPFFANYVICYENR